MQKKVQLCNRRNCTSEQHGQPWKTIKSSFIVRYPHRFFFPTSMSSGNAGSAKSHPTGEKSPHSIAFSMETLVWHEHQVRIKYWKNIILSCAHRRKRWLQLSFYWSLTWDLKMWLYPKQMGSPDGLLEVPPSLKMWLGTLTLPLLLFLPPLDLSHGLCIP